MSKNNFLLVKKYFHHRKHKDFRKTIVFVKNHRDQISNNLVYIQYYFTNGVHPVGGSRHGNAKSDETHNYCKVKPSVKKVAQKENTTKRSVAKNVENVGGISKVKNPADLLNSKSLYYSKRAAASDINISSNACLRR